MRECKPTSRELPSECYDISTLLLTIGSCLVNGFPFGQVENWLSQRSSLSHAADSHARRDFMQNRMQRRKLPVPNPSMISCRF
ncbi:hypothetical protein Ciccas_008974 [Cichlidogyrus casuarinus]|uniref:Uncharacterized protein n=1 Tax=Cichlidogyrus casuarinus TaxID=1844966 RepID=A0ABD2PZB0_9PLAT